MANQTSTADGGTEREPTRYEDEISGADLIEGDRIDPRLVARHPDQLGAPIRRTQPNEEDFPDTQLVVVTALDTMQDVHSALLFDPETDTFVRAGKHDSQSAWTQAEADWTVREVGEEVVVEEVHDLERPEGERDENADEYAQHWVEIVFADVRFTGGDPDVSDERELDGTTLKLRDVDGRKLLASISLE